MKGKKRVLRQGEGGGRRCRGHGQREHIWKVKKWDIKKVRRRGDEFKNKH